ncbi:MAG: endonuclease/exonuclease/phosphatase family protein [Actinomycetota bacterium]|nr:endonuclease/exonuclease/phosphatase family protein [Actinomycetota bacterium]
MARTTTFGPVRAAVCALAAAVLLALLTASSPAPTLVSAAPGVSPQGRVLVVTANLQEAFNASDLRNMSEIGVFVPRLLGMLPYRPDVLLLQDVRKKAVVKTAELLTKKTGDRYKIGQRLRTEPWQKLPNNVWYSTETAVVFNSATMEMKGRSGFVRIRNPWGNPKGDYVEYKGQAYFGAVERAGGAEVGVMSVHLPKEPVENRTTAKRFAPWIERLATFMEKRYPNATRIIGGDFNQTRCLGKDPCEYSPFWKKLTSKAFGYTDALWTIQEPKHYTRRLPLGVDLIFSTGDVRDAGGDVKNPPVFYSDHRFFWADLELGPAPTSLTATARQQNGDLVVDGSLKPALDGVTIRSTLQTLQGDAWEDLSAADSQTAGGHYVNTFADHPLDGSCRFHSVFAGTKDYAPSVKTTVPFDCSGADLPAV